MSGNGEIKGNLKEHFHNLRSSLSDNDWDEYKIYVTKTLEALVENVDSLRTKDIPSIKTDIQSLKIKSGLWGFVAGAVPVALAIIAKVFLG